MNLQAKTELESTISAEFVRSILDYDEVTGIFTWKWVEGARLSDNRRRAGKPAGSINGEGYVHIRIGKFRPLGHRIAVLLMTGEWPVNKVDHKNLVRHENWWDNIRPSTPSQNNSNSRTRRDNTIGIKGVRKRGNKFDALITSGRTQKYLGSFDCPAVASFAYQIAADNTFGEFARAL